MRETNGPYVACWTLQWAICGLLDFTVGPQANSTNEKLKILFTDAKILKGC
jgi:hypothetical protein